VGASAGDYPFGHWRMHWLGGVLDKNRGVAGPTHKLLQNLSRYQYSVTVTDGFQPDLFPCMGVAFMVRSTNVSIIRPKFQYWVKSQLTIFVRLRACEGAA
jgi:hypothetical protein